MNASPPCSVEPELLRGWLDGHLADDAARALEAHIETCPACQAELDRLTACRVPTLYTPISPRGTRHSDPPTSVTSQGETHLEGVSGDGANFVPALSGFTDFRPLGRGGMGTVFLARQIALDRLVAVKFIAGDHQHDAASIARMRAEAKIIASLKHPQIVTIHDVIEQQGRPVLILEYIEGGSLVDLCQRERVSPLLACRLMELVGHGVQAAHERGVLHRDLKPSNILMDGYNPKITDFGLARSVDAQERLTSSGKLFGTPQYMAPEVIRKGSEATTPAADVYALGVILYELIAGVPPFSGGSTYDVLERIVREPPPPIDSRVKSLNPRIAKVCEAALHKDPARRPKSALEFSQLLHNIIEEEQRHGAIPELAASTSRAISREANASPMSPPAATSPPAGAGWRRRWVGWVVASLLVVVTAAIVWMSRPPEEPADDAGLATQPTATANGASTSDDGGESSASGDVMTMTSTNTLAGTHWSGWFDFHPIDGSPDGDAELVIDSQTGHEFAGTYYSEQRNYAWKVQGRLEEDRISWEFVEAIKDNETRSVVGMVEVSGTLDRDSIDAVWHQTGLTPCDADMQFGRVLGANDVPAEPLSTE